MGLLAERGVTVNRWVQEFGPELTKRTERHLRRASVNWHVDETYVRVAANGATFGGRRMPTEPPLNSLCFAICTTEMRLD